MTSAEKELGTESQPPYVTSPLAHFSFTVFVRIGPSLDRLSGARQQMQRLGVSRPERTKVPPIECGESWFVEPFYHGEHCRRDPES
jgi:hypothetical protein